MKRYILFTGLMIASAGFKSFAQTAIETKEAAKHLKEKVTVTDKVHGGKFFSNSGMTLLDLGGAHPNELLTVLIKGDDRKKFKDAPEETFKGKIIIVTGEVIDYKGKPEIVVTEPAQIKIREEKK